MAYIVFQNTQREVDSKKSPNVDQQDRYKTPFRFEEPTQEMVLLSLWFPNWNNIKTKISIDAQVGLSD